MKLVIINNAIIHLEFRRNIMNKDWSDQNKLFQKNKSCSIAKKRIDPVAICGFSCNHCFLAQYCGGCRSEYNTCSYATEQKDGICPNVACCKEKGLDGCYQCEKILECHKGFYFIGNSGANAAKAQALFTAKYGKKNFLKVCDIMHQIYQFKKTQEILGQDVNEGLRILEEAFENNK